MNMKRDLRLRILEVAVRWYRDARPGSEDHDLATVGLYAAHGAPFGRAGDAGAAGLAIWMDFETWTTTN